MSHGVRRESSIMSSFERLLSTLWRQLGKSLMRHASLRGCARKIPG
jgi:hypothetical protein